MIGVTLRNVRDGRDWTQRTIGFMAGVSSSLVNEWEHGRRRITEAIRTRLARKMDDGQFYMALKRDATGGPTAAPWLNGIDEHRLACAMKTVEELSEAQEAITKMIPHLVMQPDKITGQGRETIAAGMLELIECTTAAENTLGRLAREYDMSLAALWDRHEAELVEKGYIQKEKPPNQRAVM